MLKYLNPDFEFCGTDREKFRTIIGDLDAITRKVVTNSKNLLVLHFLEEAAEKFKFLICGCADPFTPQTTLKCALFPKARFTEPLLKEIKKNGLCLYDASTKQIYAVAASADFNCLGFFGQIARKNNLPRALMLAEALRERHDDLGLIVREAGDPLIRKVVGIRSHKYAYIPQKLVDDIIDEFGKRLGSPADFSYVVRAENTYVSVYFPDSTAILSDVYEREIIPGIRIETSDTGDSAFRIIPLCRVGENSDSEIYSPKAVHVRHCNDASAEKVVSQCDRVFAEFTEIPKALCALATIPLFEGGNKAQNIADYSDLIDDISKTIKIDVAIGAKALTVAKTFMKDGYAGGTITAFDVAETFLSLPATLGGMAASTATKLKEAVYGVLKYDFSDVYIK